MKFSIVPSLELMDEQSVFSYFYTVQQQEYTVKSAQHPSFQPKYSAVLHTYPKPQLNTKTVPKCPSWPALNVTIQIIIAATQLYYKYLLPQLNYNAIATAAQENSEKVQIRMSPLRFIKSGPHPISSVWPRLSWISSTMHKPDPYIELSNLHTMQLMFMMTLTDVYDDTYNVGQ